MSSYLYALDTVNKRPKPIKVDSDGNLQVDVVSMTGGGDATASNQVLAKGVLDNILTKNGEIKSSTDLVKTAVDNVNTSLANNATSTLQTAGNASLVSILSKNTDIKTAVDNVNTSLNDNATATKQQTLITGLSSFESANHSDLLSVVSAFDNIEPHFQQSTLINNASIASGSDSSEIDMGSNRHLTLFGTSNVNFANWILVRKSASGGTTIPDGSSYISTEEVLSGSGVYSFSHTFKNVGTRYLALRNTHSGSQTATVYAVLHR